MTTRPSVIPVLISLFSFLRLGESWTSICSSAGLLRQLPLEEVVAPNSQPQQVSGSASDSGPTPGRKSIADSLPGQYFSLMSRMQLLTRVLFLQKTRTYSSLPHVTCFVELNFLRTRLLSVRTTARRSPVSGTLRRTIVEVATAAAATHPRVQVICHPRCRRVTRPASRRQSGSEILRIRFSMPENAKPEPLISRIRNFFCFLR